MVALFSDPAGNLAYFNGQSRRKAARRPVTTANRDQEPVRADCDITSDAGVALLRRIADKP
jgi:hypothetical protein